MKNESVSAVLLQRPDGSWVEVGYLHHSENRNWFEFLESYWNLADRPVVGQIFEERGRHWRANAHVALPPWFGHLLPEGRVRELVADAAGSSSKNEYNLIVRLGADDLQGAVRVVGIHERQPTVPPELADSDESNPQDPLLKFSLAGVQFKFSVAGDEKALTVPAKGRAGNIILKFPDGRPGYDGVPEAELGSLELASRSGIDSARGFLVDPKSVRGLEKYSAGIERKALAVHRFDRKADDRRVHMEEMAQILDISTSKRDAKYLKANFETIAILVGALTGIEAVGEVIDRIVFNVLIGNGDAHLKNWAVLYADGRVPGLSPAYDLVPTVIYLPDDNLGLNLNKSKRFSDVTVHSFENLGRRTGYGEVEARRRAADAVEQVMDHIELLSDYLSKASLERLRHHRMSLDLLPSAR